VNRSIKPEQDYFLIAKGGEGGLGNSNFTGNQTTLPRFATRGKKGDVLELELELKTLADIGLVGFPNSGKRHVFYSLNETLRMRLTDFILFPNMLYDDSTLIHTLTNSRAEIAPYPFTTLNPQIGTLIIFNDGTWDLDETQEAIEDSPTRKEYLDAGSATDLIRDRSSRARSGGALGGRKSERMRLRIADCPGLLPKASENVGLGHAFLRHIERSRMLVVVVDLMAGVPAVGSRHILEDPDPQRCCRDLETLFQELDSYQPGLSARVGIVIANKADLSCANSSLKQLAQVRLQALHDYMDVWADLQARNGLPLLHHHHHQSIVVLPLSAKFRQNIRQLVLAIQHFFESHPL
jgi:GTP-binding protein